MCLVRFGLASFASRASSLRKTGSHHSQAGVGSGEWAKNEISRQLIGVQVNQTHHAEVIDASETQVTEALPFDKWISAKLFFSELPPFSPQGFPI